MAADVINTEESDSSKDQSPESEIGGHASTIQERWNPKPRRTPPPPPGVDVLSPNAMAAMAAAQTNYGDSLDDTPLADYTARGMFTRDTSSPETELKPGTSNPFQRAARAAAATSKGLRGAKSPYGGS